MPLFGAHLSIAGGVSNALRAAAELECETVQLFTKNASQWSAKPLAEADQKQFLKESASSGLQFLTAHDSYLINLASPDEVLFQKSLDAFTIEIERAEQLGLTYLVTHPGAHVGSGEAAGLARIVDGLQECLQRTAGVTVRVLLETTAGQGSTLGCKLEHLETILKQTDQWDRLGVCVDTCHIFAAGYELATESDHASFFDEFDSRIGLSALHLFHLNDSVKGCGSRVDRHAGLGLGKIGLEPFRRIVQDRRFAERPMILETPKEDDAGEPMDPVNLAILRQFRAAIPA
ncbi:MAG: deoxyribonuclease IV [Gemmataceae bacterium]